MPVFEGNEAKRAAAMLHHLQYNHYPPVPSVMVAVCLAAVDAIVDQHKDTLIALPPGATYRDGRTEVEAWRLADSFHLWDFVEGAEDDEDDEGDLIHIIFDQIGSNRGYC